MPTKKTYPPQEKIDLFDKLIASMPEIERKGDIVPYTSLNGNMFTQMNKSGSVGLRLCIKDREKFILFEILEKAVSECQMGACCGEVLF